MLTSCIAVANKITDLFICKDTKKLLCNKENAYCTVAHLHSAFFRCFAQKNKVPICLLAVILAETIHHFFHTKGFIYLAAPIITSNDCEGAGENFIIQDDANNSFFQGIKAGLTVSGQLNAESYALGMKKVYTFGPTFRAERSHTNRHLAEF